MDPLSALLAGFAEMTKELHLVARRLRDEGGRDGTADAFLIEPGKVYQVVGDRGRGRKKWLIQNVDPSGAGGNLVEWFYKPDIPFGRGFEVFNGGGSYVDDARTCYQGPIYVRCDPTLAAVTQVKIRAGEEFA